MENKILTVSIIGVGARGGEAYGRYIHKCADKFNITHLCDINEERLDKYAEAFEVKKENCFTDENTFFAKKRSDVLLICTMDRQHVAMAEKALDLGYDILLEKPVSDNTDELRRLVRKANEAGRVIMVCHVLRYTVMINKLKEIIDNGGIGKLVAIDQTENVGSWHQAHSFVRGNWRNSVETSPMILQKCCHDMDLLQYFAGAKCQALSSMGSLFHFKKENQPQGAADRCVACQYVDSCPFSAKKIYVDMWKESGNPENRWPMNVITDAYPLTEEAIQKAIEEGPYGRCVYACDNDVVDNQTVVMHFENGITATLKMEGFTKKGGRDIRFFGTEGELEMDEEGNFICLRRYFGEDKTWKIDELTDDLEGHGGGDHRMIDKLYEVVALRNENIDTCIENSVESHYMSLAAEESRVNGGILVEIGKYRA
jgi:predicted dehydrogenase